VTVFLARYDASTRTLHYGNAGHNPPIVAGRNGSARTLRPTGAAIGLADESSFETVPVQLSPGDRLLAFTDGVVELPNEKKEQFGDDRLIGLLNDRQHHRTAREIVGSIRNALENFSGSRTPHDDTTIVALVVSPDGMRQPSAL